MQFLVQDAKLALEAAKLATDKQISSAKKELAAAISAVPFDPQRIITLQDNLKSYQDGRARLDEIETTYF